VSVMFCSLQASLDQVIHPKLYTLLRFPFDDESTDVWGMHQPVQPDGRTVQYPRDPESGLIWPAAEGLGHLTACIHWEAGGYTEIRDQFVRDPLGVPDTTATDHRAPSPGQQFFTKHHEIIVRPGVPLGLFVYHNDSKPRKVTYAQLKLSIHPLAVPGGDHGSAADC
jgi:hypothetical protein